MSHTTTEKSKAADVTFAWQICFGVMLAVAALAMPDMVFASPAPAGLDNMFCTVAGWFTGSTGKGLATVAITIIGIGALLGKVSWGMALIVGVGVAVIFGAASIVEALGVGAPTAGGGGCTASSSTTTSR